MSEISIAGNLQSYLLNKPENFKLAYMLAHAAAGSGAQTNPVDVFSRALSRFNKFDQDVAPKSDA